MKFGELNKKIVLIISFFIMGFTVCSSSETEQNSNKINLAQKDDEIQLYAKNYKVKIKSCILNIPSRYKLQKFHYETPKTSSNKPYRVIKFGYFEKDSIAKYYILQHSILIANNKWDLKNLTSKFKFISSKIVSDVKILRYKNREIKLKDKTDSIRCRNVKLYKTNNILIVQGKNFTIIIDETDKYLNEMYAMFKDCMK